MVGIIVGLSHPFRTIAVDEEPAVVMIEDEVVDFDVEETINARKVALLEDLPPQSEPWLQARKLGIGGSDAAAVLGLGDFKSAFEVYLDKTGRHPDGLTIPENSKMMWGRILEDPVADHTARVTGCVHAKSRWLYQHRQFDYMLGNVDRIVLDPARPTPGIYEGKTCGEYMADRWGDDETDSPAMYALIQAVHYMDVLDLTWADIAVLIGGQDYRHYRVERDDELVEMLRAYEADFWDHVQRRVEPPVSGSIGDTDLLQRLYEAVHDKQILVGEEAVELTRTYREQHAIAKAAEDAKSEAGNRLRQLMGDAEIAVDVYGREIATWKQHETTKFEQKRFQTEMPRFAATYTHKAPQRTLRVKDV